MSNSIYAIFWTTNAKLDLKDIYLSLEQNFSLAVASKVTDEIFESVNSITFPNQFQIDEYRIDCRRIITRNTKYFTNSITTQFTLLEYSILFKTQ